MLASGTAANRPPDGEVPLDRLLDYQLALAALGDREEISTRTLGRGVPGLASETLRDDLERLGFDAAKPLPMRSLDRALGHAVDDRLATGPPVEIRREGAAEAGELTACLRSAKARSLETARRREAAFDLAQHAGDHFLFALARHPIEICAYRHQIESVKALLERSACAIVADEVGLGKTIVGGLAVFEMIDRQVIQDCLILVPGNLLDQWKKELGKFFGREDVPVITRRDRASLEALASKKLVLMTLDRAKDLPFRDVILDREWDCLMVDEAHRLRNASISRARFCFSVRARHRVYLTATPVHNGAYDIFNLMTQLRPGLFGSRKDFLQSHLLPEGGILDPEALRTEIGRALSRKRRADTGLTFPKRKLQLIEVKKRHAQEKEVYEAVMRFLRDVYSRQVSGTVSLTRPSGEVTPVRTVVLVSMLVLRELGSHPRAALATLGGAFRDRLGEVARKTRNTSDLGRLDRLMTGLGKLKWGRGTHAKTDRLLESLPAILENSEKCIVYAEFLETVEALERLIAKDKRCKGVRTVVFHGGLPRKTKEERIQRFGEAPPNTVFLSTDCGGEGLNLQVAGAIVNYDFPWNPMRIEQRIGRVDRLKQERKVVYVHNLITRGTIEEHVYRVLQTKLQVCGAVMGELEPPLTRVVLRRPEDLGIGNLILSARNDAEMEKAFRRMIAEIEDELEDRDLFR